MDAQQIDQLLKKKAGRARAVRIVLYSVVAVLCVAILGGIVTGAYYAGSWVVDRLGENPVETQATDPIETDPTETKPPETDPTETNPPETDPTETNPVETDPTETEPSETTPTQPGEITHTLQLVWFEDGVERPWKVGITVLHNRKQVKAFNLLQANGWRCEWTDTYHASELTLCGEFLAGMSGVVSVSGENFVLTVILDDSPDTQPTKPVQTNPTAPLDSTLPPTGLNMWPAAVLLAMGAALVVLGLWIHRRKKR